MITIFHLQDEQQDLTHFTVDENGIVLDAGCSGTLQRLYGGMKVDNHKGLDVFELVRLIPTDTSYLQEPYTIKYPIESIETQEG